MSKTTVFYYLFHGLNLGGYQLSIFYCNNTGLKNTGLKYTGLNNTGLKNTGLNNTVAEFKEFERRFKFKPRFKYAKVHLKLYQMFQDLSRRLI